MLICGNNVTINGTQDKLFTAALDTYSVKDIFNEITFGYLTPNGGIRALCFTGFPTIVTQAWTNSVELFFYLTAPFVVKLYRRSKTGYILLLLMSLFYMILTVFMNRDFPTFRYRSVFGSYWVFLLGVTLFFNAEKIIKLRHPQICFTGLIVFYFAIFAFGGEAKAVLNESKILFSVLVAFFVVVTSLQFRVSRSLDLSFGILSIGIYMSQNIARAVLLFASSKSYKLNILFGYGTNRFVIWMLVCSSMLAVFLYVAVDKPLEKARNRIRSKR